MKASIDAFNAHDMNRVISYESESIVEYAPDHPKGAVGHDSRKISMMTDFRALPDLQFRVERIVGQGDEVSVRGFLTGTNTGPMMTPKGKTVKASMNRLDLSQAYFHKLQDGKIVETHVYWDTKAVVAQLGLLRKNTQKSLAYILVGIILLFVSFVNFLLNSEPILLLIGLMCGTVIIMGYVRWMVRRLLEFGTI